MSPLVDALGFVFVLVLAEGTIDSQGNPFLNATGTGPSPVRLEHGRLSRVAPTPDYRPRFTEDVLQWLLAARR